MRTIRCWRLRTLLTSYVDSEVPGAERRRVEEHLRYCAACRHRVGREQAVRQQLRRWSAELRNEGTLSSLSAAIQTPANPRTATLLGIGAASTALIVFVLVTWGGWLPGSSAAFAAAGHITDDRCADGHTHSGPALMSMNGGHCVRRCIEMGARYVFVSRGIVYSIRNQDFSSLTQWAGQTVEVEGTVRQNVLTVSQVRP